MLAHNVSSLQRSRIIRNLGWGCSLQLPVMTLAGSCTIRRFC
jgi:hypothetical protein